MTVFVEASVLEDVHLKNNPLFVPIKDKVRTFRDGKDDLTDKVDFIVCLGGDGTLLYASSLFQVGTITPLPSAGWLRLTPDLLAKPRKVSHP